MADFITSTGEGFRTREKFKGPTTGKKGLDWLTDISTKTVRIRLPDTVIEAVVNPWRSVVSTPKLRDRTPPQEILPNAFIEWGAESSFRIEEGFRTKASRVSISVDTDDDDEEEARPRWLYNGGGGAFTDIISINSEDQFQFIVQRNANTLVFRGPGGDQVQFIMNPAAGIPGEVPGSGQFPPSPPMGEM